MTNRRALILVPPEFISIPNVLAPSLNRARQLGDLVSALGRSHRLEFCRIDEQLPELMERLGAEEHIIIVGREHEPAVSFLIRALSRRNRILETHTVNELCRLSSPSLHSGRAPTELAPLPWRVQPWVVLTKDVEGLEIEGAYVEVSASRWDRIGESVGGMMPSWAQRILKWKPEEDFRIDALDPKTMFLVELKPSLGLDDESCRRLRRLAEALPPGGLRCGFDLGISRVTQADESSETDLSGDDRRAALLDFVGRVLPTEWDRTHFALGWSELGISAFLTLWAADGLADRYTELLQNL